MADLLLEVDARSVTGKKVKSLRKQGITPAHLYGRTTESLTLQAPTQVVKSLLRTAGRNAIIDLKVNGEGETRPVVLRGVQRDPITDELVHIDFLQISLSEKLRADVRIVLTGEAPGVSMHGGVLLQNLDTISVEALPTDVPERVEVDVSTLEELDSAIFVRELSIPGNVEVLSDGDQLVAKVEPPKIAAEIEAEEAAAKAEAAEAEEGAEAAEEGAEEGAAPAPEGESKDQAGSE